MAAQPPPYGAGGFAMNPAVTQQPGFYPVVPGQEGGMQQPMQMQMQHQQPMMQQQQPMMQQQQPMMQQQQPMMQMRPDNCPPGLEYLAQIDQVICKQKVEVLEAIFGCETKNKYKMKNSMGQEIYHAKEDTDCCTRNCCGPVRPFGMVIKDNNDQEVIHLDRPLACQSCCFPCCLQTIDVQAPPGTSIGSVEQEWSLCNPAFVIKDQNGEVALRIEGPCLTYSFCGDVEFKVLSPDGETEVGKISKQWSGLLREAFTDADNFGISFPMDLDVRMKAVLLGAMFLIDFMFFEKAKNEETDGIGML